MKQHFTKRLLALLLTLAMVLSLVPMTFAEETAADEYVLATELKDGDQVVIYNPGSKTAVSSTVKSNYYLTPVETTVEDDAITDPDASVVWTVAVNEDGSYTFTQGEFTLAAYASGTHVNLSNTAEEHDPNWIVTAINSTEKTYNLKSATVEKDSKPVYLEYYSRYTEFSAYATDDATGDAFAMQFYVLNTAEEPIDPPEPGAKDVIVLYTNDIHCGVDQTDSSIGIAGLAKVKKELKNQYNNVVLVDNGDAIQGELIGTVSKGEYMVQLMNYVGFDFAVFGNHEYDYTMPQLKKLVDMANVKYLSCNFRYIGETPDENAVDLDAYTVVDYDGLKVGYVGITTPESLVKSTPTYFQDENGNWIYTFCNGGNGQELYDAVQTAVDAARADGAQVVVALAHLGIDEQSSPWMSTDVIANTTGIDVMLDGHSHSTIERQEVANKNGETVLLSSTGTKLANVGKLTITPDGTVNTELIQRSDVDGVDPETQAYLEQIEAEFEAMKQQVVAHVDYDLLTTHPETGKRMIRMRETNLGDVCADAYRTVLESDIAFVNGGGIRANIPAGDVTYEQIISVHPYSNMACKVKATGQQILDALEMSARNLTMNADGELEGENGGFLHVSGLKFTINLAIPSSVVVDESKMFVEVAGKRRVQDVKVLQNGEYVPIDPEGTYTLASHNYMLKNSGDGINMFKDDELLLDEVKVDNQVLIEYMTSEAFAAHDYSNWEGEGRITIKNGFDDVQDPSKYYYTPVYWAYNFDPQITGGKTDSLFGVKDPCTREQIVTFLWKAYGAEEPTNTDNPFTDVKEGKYYFKAVMWAKENNITSGKTDTKFGVKEACTREQVVTFLWKAAGKPEPTITESPFTDVKEGKYYTKAVLWALENGVTGGVSADKFGVGKTCTRGQIVTFLYAALAKEHTCEFLVTSDLHGQIFATDYTMPFEQSGTYKRGLTRVSSYIKEQRKELGENLYVVDMGDTFQGAPLTYYYAFNKPEEKDPAILAFRSIGYDMWVVGNHEFNYGLPILTRQMDYAVSESTENEKQLTISMANYLKAETNNDETKDWATWRDVTPYVIKEFDGLKVAVIGFGNPNIPKWDVPANWDGIYFADIIETYKHYEPEMLAQADMIVVVAHSGIDSDPGSDFIKQLVNETNTIAFAFSGHEHGNQVYMTKNSDGEEIPILQPYTKARAIAQVRMTKIGASEEVTIVPEIKNMENYTLDEELAELLQPYETDTWKNYMLQPIGKALGDYPAANLGTAPSAFMDLINTVQTWGAYDNTGLNTPDKTEDDTPAMLSISAPLTSGDKANLIAEGDIFLGDMFGLYRFENWFYQITMSGEEVHQWLEFAATKIKVDDEGKPYVTNSDLTYYDVIMGDGFHYDIDVSKPEGERVVKMTWNGADVTADQEFTVVVNNYRYNGGGNYVKWLNEHGCEFIANDPDRIIYSTQFDMIQGEDEGQARALLVSYIKKETAEHGGITPFITSTWTVQNGTSEEPETGWTASTAFPENGKQYAIVAKTSDGKFYALDNYEIQGTKEVTTATELEINAKTMTIAELPETVLFDAVVDGDSIQFMVGTDYLHLNASKVRVINGTTNSHLSFTKVDGSDKLYTLNCTENNSVLTFTGERFSASTDTAAVPAQIYLFTAG